MLAAAAVKDWLAAQGVQGRVRYYGCPAEEGGAAKTFMVRDGVFDDVDIAISWHPAPFAGVNEAIRWHPASTTPSRPRGPRRRDPGARAQRARRGRADERRRQLSARAHAVLRADPLRPLNSGGIAPNVVQAHAKLRYIVRAADLPALQALAARVDRIAEGAALMTETTMERRVVSGMSNLLGNAPLERTLFDNLQRLGPPPFDAADRAFAEEIRKTVSEDDIDSAHRRFGIESPTPRCVTGSSRSRRRARAWWARPMSAT